MRCCIMSDHKAKRQVQKSFVTEGTCMLVSIEGENCVLTRSVVWGKRWASKVHQVA